MLKDPRKNTRKHLYQIIGILVLCVAMVAVSYNFTLAWFMDQSVTSNGEPNVTIIGTIDINVTTNFNFYNLALAPDTTYYVDGNGQDISTKIKTSSNNDIKTVYARIKFTCNRSELSLVFGSNVLDDDTDVTRDYDTSAGSTDKNKWVFNPEDQYYYYLGEVGSTDIVFNTGYHVDNSLHNAKADAPVDIEFRVEAIQRPYGASAAVWDTAPNIFETFVISNN